MAGRRAPSVRGGAAVGRRLGDSLGRKRLFLLGMAAFTITSLACGLAPRRCSWSSRGRRRARRRR